MPYPICTGNNEEHCCWIDGVECEFLRENDPRTTDGRRWACGLFLDLKDAAPPNMSAEKIWERVTRHPHYEANQMAFFQSKGIDPCATWKGGIRPDGSIIGQCCYKGWEWDADGNVTKQP